MNAGQHLPPRRTGLIIHSILILLFSGIASSGFVNLTRVEVGTEFLVSLLIALGAFLPLPLFAYRAYALLRAGYQLDRDRLSIHWGLRREDIPLTDIEWIRPADDLTRPLSLPAFSLPGGILGMRRHADLGWVEFLASDARKLLLVATAKRVFVISPQEPGRLAQAFARATELGSTTPAEAVSIFPSFIVLQAWRSDLARFLWLTTLFLNLGLFVWASLIIPSTPRVALGQQFAGSPLETVPSSQLILFPLASLLLSVGGWIAGLYFYRGERQRVLAFLVWGSSTLASLQFLAAVLFIITTPV